MLMAFCAPHHPSPYYPSPDPITRSSRLHAEINLTNLPPMPARHLGFSKGSAASFRALLPFDFLVPFSAHRVAHRRRYARLAVQEVDVYEVPESSSDGLQSRWSARTGDAVGEGSSAGATRASLSGLRRNTKAATTRAPATDGGHEQSGRNGQRSAAQPRKVPRSPAAPFTITESTPHIGPDLGRLKHKPSKDGTSGGADARVAAHHKLLDERQRTPETASSPLPASAKATKFRTDSSAAPTRSHTLSSRLFGKRPSAMKVYSPASTLSHASTPAPDAVVAPPRSFTHKHLSQPDRIPPTASAIFDHLSGRQSLATPQALTPLINYSRRTGHYLVQLRAGEVRARLAGQYRIVGDEGEYGYDRLAGETVEGQTLGMNGWAAKAYPPRRFRLPLDVNQALRNLHYRLISVTPKNPAPRPVEVVEQLRNLCAAEERGRDGLVEALSAMLNLYVIYAERSLGHGSPFPALNEVLSLCPELSPTKQTLHLIVQGLLWPRQLEYTGRATGSPEHEAPPRKARMPSNSPDVRSRLEDVLDRFQTKYNISPGTETFRNVLLFASMTDDPVLASVAFDGWWIADSAKSSITPGEGDQARFLHRAKRWRKFRHVLRMLKLRGWLRVVGGEGVTRRGRYAWCGPSERGVDDVVGLEEMSPEEQEGVRSKRESWTARDKKRIEAEHAEPERDAEAELARWKIARAREKRKKRPGAAVNVPAWRNEGLVSEGEEDGAGGTREEVWW